MSDRDKIGGIAVNIAVEEMHKGAGEVLKNNKGVWCQKYLEPTRLDEGNPWCAAFVSWCVQEACHRLSLQPMPFTYSAGALDIFRQCRADGMEVHEPQRGDLVVWRRGSQESGFGHIGFVWNSNEGRIETIEGNHNKPGEALSKVNKFHYVVKDELGKPFESRLVGFIRLK